MYPDFMIFLVEDRGGNMIGLLFCEILRGSTEPTFIPSPVS